MQRISQSHQASWAAWGRKLPPCSLHSCLLLSGGAAKAPKPGNIPLHSPMLTAQPDVAPEASPTLLFSCWNSIWMLVSLARSSSLAICTESVSVSGFSPLPRPFLDMFPLGARHWGPEVHAHPPASTATGSAVLTSRAGLRLSSVHTITCDPGWGEERQSEHTGSVPLAWAPQG